MSEPTNEISTAAESHSGNTSSLTAMPAGRMKLVGAISLMVCLMIYVLRLDKVVGLVVDDAWYVLLAKSLANGQGYSLINSPSPNILPLYPPGFPFLLSLFFRIHPDFPGNVWLLKSVTIGAMMIVGILCYCYFRNMRHLPPFLAWGIGFMTVTCPPLVFLATSSVMSDGVFTLWFLLTIVTTEACKRAGDNWKGRGFAVLAAAFSSGAFLTRSIGVSLIVAAFLYLLKERLVRSALIYTALITLFCSPWMIYSRLHAPTLNHQLEQGGNMVLPYTDQFWQKIAGDSSSGTDTVANLPNRVWKNSIEFLGQDVCHILTAVFFEALKSPFEEAQKVLKKRESRREIIPLSMFLSIFVIFGYFAVAREKVTFAEIAVPLSLAVIILWPFETFRYVLPLAPFVTFYFLRGALEIQRLIRRKHNDSQVQWGIMHLALVLLIAINLFGNIRYIANLHFGSFLDKPIWISKFEEAEKVFEKIRQQVPKTDVIASLNPAMVTLYTGHKTVSWDDPSKRWETWKTLSVRYMVWISVYPQQIDDFESNYRQVYLSREGSGFRILDLGPPETRVPWGTRPK